MLRYCDSFDHYSTSQIGLKWVVTAPSTAPTIVSGGRLNNCIHFVQQLLSECSIKKAFDNQATWVVGVAANYTTSAFDSGFISFYDNATRQVGLFLDSAGHLNIEKSGVTLSTSSNTWISGWNYIEIKVVFASGSSVTTVKVNGATWITYTGSISASGNQYANTVKLGDYLGSNHASPVLLMDDAVILDGQGSVNNTFIGDVTVDCLYPDGAGNYTAFTPVGAAANYNCVNEHPADGDTTYVSSQAVNTRDSYTLSAVAGTISDVKGIQIVQDMRKQGSGDRSVGAFVRVVGTDYDRTGFALSTSYAMFATIIEINPDSNATWTAVEIAALEAGPKVTL